MDTSSNSNHSLQLPQIIYDDPQYAKDFTDGREDLLKLAFVGHEKVYVEKSLSGYSGAQTWRVSTEKGQFFVVKLAHPTIIEREDDNYRRHVAGGLYRNAAHPEERPFKGDNKKWALFKSTFVGLYQSQTLLEYLDKGSADIATILKNIFIDHGQRWWTTNELTPIKCSVYYDRFLPVHLELDFFDGEDKGAHALKAGEVTQSDIIMIEDMVSKRQTPNIFLKGFRPEKIRDDLLTITATPQANVRSPQIRIKLSKALRIVPDEVRSDPDKTIAFLREKLEEGIYANNLTTRRQRMESYAEKALEDFSPGRDTFVVESMKYPNPIVYLQRLLNENYNTKVSPRIHGDLNLANVLIELDENNEGYKQPWLIDFAETSEGPILLDLQWLEEQVTTKFLAPILASEMNKAGLSVNVLVDILEALHEFRELPRDLPSILQKPYTVLQEIRRLVRDNNYLSVKNDWSEYYRGLVIALVGAMRFEELGPLAQKVAFLSAATVIRWTKVSPHDLPKRLFPEPSKRFPPIINSSNLPELILRGHSFWLSGKASAGTTVQIIANKVVMVTTVPDTTGNWQVEIQFDKIGRYSVITRDERTALESPSIPIQVVEAPVIERNSLPTQIFQRQKFVLQGNAQAGATVQVIANQQPLVIAAVDNTGRWKTEVAFEQVGEYHMTIRDNVTATESAPVTITVLKRKTVSNALRILLSISAVIFTVIGVTWLVSPDRLSPWLDPIATTIATWIRNQPETSVAPTPPTDPALPTATDTPLPPLLPAERALAALIAKGKVVVAASEESGPFSYYDETTKRLEGLEVDLVREMVRRWFKLPEGVNPEDTGNLVFERIPVTERRAKVVEEGIDFVIGSVSYDLDRCERDRSEGRICTSDPYAYDIQALLVREDSDITEYCDPDLELAEASIILLSNTTGDMTREDYKIDCDFQNNLHFTYASTRADAVYEVLQFGGLRTYKTNRWLLDFLIKHPKVPDAFDPHDFRIIPSKFGSDQERTVMWLNQDNEDIKVLIDETLDTLRSERELGLICKQHFGEEDTNCGLTVPISATPEPTTVLPSTESTVCNSDLPKIKIGIAINESKRYGIFGKDQIIGYLLAVKYFNERGGVNKRCIEPIALDLESSVESATLESIFQKLIDQGVVAIIGPGLSQQVVALQTMLNTITTPVIGPSTTRPGIVCGNAYFSRVSAPGRWYIGDTVLEAVDEIIEQLISNKPKIALAYARDDAFTKAEFETFQGIIEQDASKNYELLPNFYEYETTWSDTELEALATKIKDANPNIVIISGLTLDGVTLIKQLRRVGYSGTLIGGNGLNTPYILDNCTECNDLFIPQAYSHEATELPIQQDFVVYYEAYQPANDGEPAKPKADHKPGQFAAQMFSAVQVIVQSLNGLDIQAEDLTEDNKLATLRAQLNQALLAGEFETPIGRFHFNTEGEIMQSKFYVAKSIKNDNDATYHFEIVRTIDDVDPEKETTGECTAPEFVP